MAENITGMESVSCGGRFLLIRPSSPRSMLCGLEPRKTVVSMGSLSGSMDGLVTWEAFRSILSKYIGYSSGFPMLESSTPPEPAWR